MMSAAGGGGLNVEDTFFVYQYEGTGAANHNIVNGVDMATDGGAIWFKNYGNNEKHNIYWNDGNTFSYLLTATTDSKVTPSDALSNYGLTSYNSNGFTVGANYVGENGTNGAYQSFTFKKQPKFFDIVTYTGSGGYQSGIQHNLGCNPGMIIVKRTDSTSEWCVWHRGMDPKNNRLNSPNVASNEYAIQDVTSSSFAVSNYTTLKASESGGSYIAFVFAHNNGDADFGATGDQDIIKCGSYTGTGGEQTINIGFEPSWLLIKAVNRPEDWHLYSTNMSIGSTEGGYPYPYDRFMKPNVSAFSSGADFEHVGLDPEGFVLEGSFQALNANGDNYIYMAIRRPMAVPESATDCFKPVQGQNASPSFDCDFNVDMAITFEGTSSPNPKIRDRLRGQNYLLAYDNNQEANGSDSNWEFYKNQNGYGDNTSAWSTYYSYLWRRAPNFFDIVSYRGGSGTGYQTIKHGLGVVPEMVWFKNRNQGSYSWTNWYVYHKDLTSTNGQGYLWLNTSSAESTDYPGWATNTFAPTDTQFTVLGNTLGYSNQMYIAYFFASLDGISKVGSFTGNGSSLNVDCGFSSGARFVLIKSLETAGNFFLFDTVRGIVSGNDKAFLLNDNGGEQSGVDFIDPYNAGFTINYNSSWGNQLNGNGYKYMFYAIA